MRLVARLALLALLLALSRVGADPRQPAQAAALAGRFHRQPSAASTDPRAQATAPAQCRPVLSMEQEVVQLGENSTAVELGVRLQGAAKQPVRAWLSLATGRNTSAADWLAAEEAAVWLSPSELSWRANESGVRTLQLRSALELVAGLEEGEALFVRIGGADGADIGDAASTQLCVGHCVAPPVFGFVPNQVAYPPANASSSSGGSSNATQLAAIPVRLVAGRLAAPGTLVYQVSLLTPAAAQFVPTRSLSGVLVFEPNTTQRSIQLPLDWRNVPPEAEYRLGESQFLGGLRWAAPAWLVAGCTRWQGVPSFTTWQAVPSTASVPPQR